MMTSSAPRMGFLVDVFRTMGRDAPFARASTMGESSGVVQVAGAASPRTGPSGCRLSQGQAAAQGWAKGPNQLVRQAYAMPLNQAAPLKFNPGDAHR